MAICFSLLFLCGLGQSDSASPPVTPPKQNPAVKIEPEVVTPDPTIGPWLVDLARHQGHLVGRTDPRSASLHVLAILKAAVRATPECADAHYWLYDIESRLGLEEGALKSLTEYVRLNPSDEAARLRLFEIMLSQQQTAEARYSFIEKELSRPGLSRVFESELYRLKARFHFERRENGEASKAVEHSLRLNPMNIGARQLAFEMFSETEPSLQRVEMALQLIAANPAQTNLVWDLGDALERIGLHNQAQEWYNRAIQLHRESNAGPVPAVYWYKLAVSYLNGKDYPRSIEAAGHALKADQNLHLARLIRATAYSKLHPNEQSPDVKYVESAYAGEIPKVKDDRNYARAAEIAWFFAFHHPDAKRAMEMAEFAMSEPEPSTLARLAWGYALRLNSRTDEAIKVLTPLAAIDQLAAFELARIQLERDKKGEAMTTLHKAATLQYDGVAYEMIAALMQKHDETPPVQPQFTRITDALKRFNRDVFDYIRRPRDYLRVTMKFADDPLPSVGPIRVLFRMENVGPFPITFGEGFMARPLIALTAMVNGVREPAHENYLQVLLNERPMLLPGDAVERTLTVNVGPIQTALLKTSADPAQVRLLAMFDPVIKDGKLTSGAGTIDLPEINATRPPIDASPEGISRLREMAASAQRTDRMMAADRIGALLAAIEAANPKSKLAETPVGTLHAELAKLLNDETWQVRAHAVVAAGWSALEPRIIAVAASPRVRNEEAIVRMLATRLFADQHGDKFRIVLEDLVESDPCDFVRMMAASYLPDNRHAANPAKDALVPATARE